MFPIVLDVSALKVVLIGEGDAALKRLKLLDAAGAADLDVYSASPDAIFRQQAGDRLKGDRPSGAALKAAGILMLAGLDDHETAAFAQQARDAGKLVNAEDRKAFCDFHVPSAVRRGDLLVTVSTGGRSPGLARRLRRHLEVLFSPQWADRLDELASRRDDWRRQGLDVPELGRRTDAYVEEKGWLR